MAAQIPDKRVMTGVYAWAFHARLIARKDLLLELRSGEVVVTGGFFALLVTVLASMTFFTGPATRDQVAAGVIWLATIFAAVLSLSRTWQREREDHALDGLMVAPIAPSAVFFGKMIGLCAFLFAIEAIVIPIAALMFNLDLLEVGPTLALFAAAATPGIAAIGTLFGAMTVRTRARDLVLSVVLFPMLAPTLLAGAVATRQLFGGAALSELFDFLKIILALDVVFTAGGLALFGPLAEQ